MTTDREANWAERKMECPRCERRTIHVYGHFTEPSFTEDGLLRDFEDTVVDRVEKECECDDVLKEWGPSLMSEAIGLAEQRARRSFEEERLAEQYERSEYSQHRRDQ